MTQHPILQVINDRSASWVVPESSLMAFSLLDDLFQVIAEMYQQEQIKLNFQRGVIVELLTWKLVSSRCNMGECLNNHRLVDYNFNSRQIDVAVLALRLRQIEGYSCKINPHQLEEKDCTNLISVSDYGLNKGFSTYLGVVGFNHTEVARQKLKHSNAHHTNSLPLLKHMARIICMS
jgi:hypothetical protein